MNVDDCFQMALVSISVIPTIRYSHHERWLLLSGGFLGGVCDCHYYIYHVVIDTEALVFISVTAIITHRDIMNMDYCF